MTVDVNPGLKSGESLIKYFGPFIWEWIMNWNAELLQLYIFLFFSPFCFLFFSSSYWTWGLPADVQTRPVGNKNNRPHCAAQKSDMLSKHVTGSAALLDIPSGAFHGERPSCRGNRPRVCILAARGVSVVTAGSLSSRRRLCCYGSAATRHLAPEQKLAPPVAFQKNSIPIKIAIYRRSTLLFRLLLVTSNDSSSNRIEQNRITRNCVFYVAISKSRVDFPSACYVRHFWRRCLRSNVWEKTV